jgi:hypothetical protein
MIADLAERILLPVAISVLIWAAGMFGGHYLLGMFGNGLAVFCLAALLLLFIPCQLLCYWTWDRITERR